MYVYTCVCVYKKCAYFKMRHLSVFTDCMYQKYVYTNLQIRAFIQICHICKNAKMYNHTPSDTQNSQIKLHIYICVCIYTYIHV